MQEAGLSLIRRVEELEKELKKLKEHNELYKEALYFYSNESNYYFETEMDYDYEETRMVNQGRNYDDLGEWAREVLDETEE